MLKVAMPWFRSGAVYARIDPGGYPYPGYRAYVTNSLGSYLDTEGLWQYISISPSPCKVTRIQIDTKLRELGYYLL